MTVHDHIEVRLARLECSQVISYRVLWHKRPPSLLPIITSSRRRSPEDTEQHHALAINNSRSRSARSIFGDNQMSRGLIGRTHLIIANSFMEINFVHSLSQRDVSPKRSPSLMHFSCQYFIFCLFAPWEGNRRGNHRAT